MASPSPPLREHVRFRTWIPLASRGARPASEVIELYKKPMHDMFFNGVCRRGRVAVIESSSSSRRRQVVVIIVVNSSSSRRQVVVVKSSSIRRQVVYKSS